MATLLNVEKGEIRTNMRAVGTVLEALKVFGVANGVDVGH